MRFFEFTTQYQVVCDGTKKGIFTDKDRAIANAKSMFKHEKEYYHIAVVDLNTGKEVWSWSAKQRDAGLDEHIVKHGSGYRLVSRKSGKNLGDFPSKAAAEKHEREVEYFKHLKEFAPTNGNGKDYLRVLASAWYNDVFNTGDLHKGIKSQEDVERILERGVICPDGKKRKFGIGYNHNFDGVVLASDDYYEYDDGGVDSRTNKPWGPYEYIEYAGNQLDEQQLDELSFRGSQCTKDCSGHRAGYEWSQRKGGAEAASWSPSFNKGAWLNNNGF